MTNAFQVFIDFDGTITREDSLEYILTRYCGQAWVEIEDRVTRHEISEKEALQAEFDLLELDMETALQDLKNIPIDPEFNSFVSFCRRNKLPLAILSGGFDVFIRKILAQNKINNIPFHANSVQIQERKWQVIPSRTPRLKNQCNHCKTFWLNQAREKGFKTIYIGDGNTDRCPAEAADIRFAKKGLAEYLRQRKLPFFEYQNFSEIQNIIGNILDESLPEELPLAKNRNSVAT